MHSYEVMLANGDRVYYKTDMSFEDFKKMIVENEWIVIEREPWVSIPRGFSSRPPKATYLTKSIVYVNWDEEWEKIDKEQNKKLEEQRKIKGEILSYVPHWKMRWKYEGWNINVIWDDKDEFYSNNYTEKYLQQILDDCIKYRCKKY